MPSATEIPLPQSRARKKNLNFNNLNKKIGGIEVNKKKIFDRMTSEIFSGCESWDKLETWKSDEIFP